MAVVQTRIGELYRQVGPIVYRRCLCLLKERAAAEDATQDLFLKLVKQPERLSELETALPWIYRVTTNHCLNLLRAAGRHDAASCRLEVSEAAAPPSTFPARHLSLQLLSRFEEQTRLIAVATLVDDMEQAEVARLLNISARTVARKLERFLVNARKFLARSDP